MIPAGLIQQTHSFNRYLDRAFRRCLEKDFVEYRQTNLSVASRVAEIFTPPKGITSFDYIFDLTGE